MYFEMLELILILQILRVRHESTILFVEPQGYSEDTLQTIIDQCADVIETNNKSLAALIIACPKGYIGVINVLLNAGADPNIAHLNFMQ